MEGHRQYVNTEVWMVMNGQSSWCSSNSLSHTSLHTQNPHPWTTMDSPWYRWTWMVILPAEGLISCIIQG